MEKQEGEEWESMIKEENTRFEDALDTIRPMIKKFESELISNTTEIPYILHGWECKNDSFSPQKTWHHISSGFSCKCWDADFSDTLFAASIQDPDGYERFTVEIYSIINKKPTLLKKLENTGSQVAILNTSVIFLRSEKDLRYSSVCIWSAEGEETIFHSNNLEENLELQRGEDGSVYIIRGDFTKKMYCLVKKKLEWLKSPHLESCIVSDTLRLPSINDTIESFSLKAEWTVSISRGIRTLWKGTKPMIWIWGDVSYDSRNQFRLDISDIRYESYTILLPQWKLSNPKPVLFPCSYYDNPLPVFIVHPNLKDEPKGLLVTAYGAYGTPTHIGSMIKRWKPLLLRGWAIASVLVPGSGDDDKEWVKSGQRLHRIHAIDSLSKSIRSIQEEHGILQSSTALYGRSAGGLLVASVAIKNPGLVGALYMESPYLDVLRTMTNPTLPLTILETSEYGTSPIDVIATAEWSPMEHIPDKGIPDLFIVARTDLMDLQVLPYEVLKFIKRSRGTLTDIDDKLVYIHKGLGHFTTSIKTRAEDLSLLYTNISKMSRKMRMTRRTHKKGKHSKNTRRRRHRGGKFVPPELPRLPSSVTKP